ncbi:hypothetical protein NS220_07300 [Microbacterium testaceum]|uniref:Ig-like domain-containing protein n=1 Tax=Microbacterium testaceum TaxID=2033 RepID=A0A147EY13_MICTE|nr:hypothetical protein [Microbacterium testaceum]KTR95001.1 hypothetical protein NS220_07300 [Microbacterium testaceum]
MNTRERAPRTRRLGVFLASLVLVVTGAVVAPQAAFADDSYVPPTLSGDCTVDSTVTLDLGTLPPDAVKSTFEWSSVPQRNKYGDPPIRYGSSDLSFTIPASAGYRVLYPGITYWYDEGDGLLYADEVKRPSCVVQPAPGAVSTSPPVVNGTVRAGETLTATPGEWSETDGWSYSYQWTGGPDRPKKDTNKQKLTLDAGYIGSVLTLTVTANKQGYVPGTASVTLPPVGIGAAPAPTDGPYARGSGQVGSPLQVDYGTWAPSNLTYTCGWYAGSTQLSSACSAYTPVPADLGKDIVVKVTGSRQGYAAGTAHSSAPVRVTAGPAATVTRTPAINGTTTVGQTVTLDQGDWNLPPNAKFSYQWLRDGSPVSGRTSGAYAIGADDGGKRLSVVVTVTAAGYTTATATTSPTAPVGKGPRPVATAAPKISGTAAVGRTLTATAGSWSKSGLTFKYTWLRNGVAIDGVTGSSLKLTSADLGTAISVRVTATSTAWETNTATSGTTSKVAQGAAPKVLTVPKISGVAAVGKKLTVSTGSWSLPSLTYTYQWLSNGNPIPGATSSSYTVKSSQSGKVITVKVVATRAGYAPGAAITAGTSPIK